MVRPRSAARKKMQPPPSSWPPPLLQPDSVDPDENFDISAFSSDRQTKASSRRKDAGIQRSKDSDLSRDDSGTNRAGRLNMQNRIGKSRDSSKTKNLVVLLHSSKFQLLEFTDLYLCFMIAQREPDIVEAGNPAARVDHLGSHSTSHDMCMDNITNATVVHFNGNMKSWLDIAMTKFKPLWTTTNWSSYSNATCV
ncbi:Galacturonosyltransferase 8 [Linum grandiflorum]